VGVGESNQILVFRYGGVGGCEARDLRPGRFT